MSKSLEVQAAETQATQLTLGMDQVCFVVMKAREFDVKDAVSEPEVGSNASDDHMISVLEDHADDPVEDELSAYINALNVDGQIDLVALAWLGRGDYTAGDWDTVREEASEAHNEHTAEYLLGIPVLPDYLEAGLETLGLSCTELEAEHL